MKRLHDKKFYMICSILEIYLDCVEDKFKLLGSIMKFRW